MKGTATLDPAAHRGRVVAVAAALLSIVGLYVIALALALSTIGAPYPGLVVDPYGSFSAVPVPFPSIKRVLLQFPDRLTSVNGRAVERGSRYGDLDVDRLRSRLRALDAAGERRLSLEFDHSGRSITVSEELRRFTVRELLVYFAFYGIAGLLLLWSGATALLLAGRRAATAPYVFLCVGSALFFGTFFDYHSTARLFPVFMLSTYWCTAGFLAVALTFPTPPSWSRPARALVTAVLGLILIAGLALAASPFLGIGLPALRELGGLLTALSCVVLLVSMILRYRRSSGQARVELRSALLAFSVVPALSALGVAVALITGFGLIHYVFPALIPLLPLSIGWALVRHNILGAHAVLTRRLFVVPVVLLSLGAATVVWLGLRSLPSGGMDALLSTVVSSGVLGAVAYGLHRLAGRYLFPAAAEFRPTIQQLAESLSDLEHRDALRDTIERTVARWLPSGRIRLLDPDQVDGIDRLPPDARPRLDAGQKVWTDDTPWARHLLVPMRSLGSLRGVLDIAPLHQGALFTEEDLRLLDTIAGLGAVALHNADVLGQLDEARRIEVDASRDDKRLTLGLISEEVAHEVSHPLLYFRSLLQRGARAPLAEDDIDDAREEITRIERLVASMRSLEPAPLRRAPVALLKPLERALALHRETFVTRGLTPEVEVPAALTVLGDHDALVQVFANLLRNAAQATPEGGRVGVTATPSPDGALTVDVWDSGPGVPDALVDKLFHRWVTTRGRDGGRGIGLHVAQGIVTRHQWRLDYLREEGRTVFRISVPRECVAASAADARDGAPPRDTD